MYIVIRCDMYLVSLPWAASLPSLYATPPPKTSYSYWFLKLTRKASLVTDLTRRATGVTPGAEGSSIILFFKDFTNSSSIIPNFLVFFWLMALAYIYQKWDVSCKQFIGFICQWYVRYMIWYLWVCWCYVHSKKINIASNGNHVEMKILMKFSFFHYT